MYDTSPISNIILASISARQLYFIHLISSFLTANWKAHVTTGSEEKASTEAKVKITVYGEKGKSAELPLEGSKEEGAEKVVHFESGKTDEFPVSISHFKDKVGFGYLMIG